MRLLALTALLQQGSAQTLKQNSMIFLENYTYAANMPAMHADQVQLASHYNLAIVGWGQDSKDWDSPSFCRNEEEKLANLSKLIKAASPTTLTAVYAGQFMVSVPTYDLQRKVMDDPAYDGFWLQDDDGNFIEQDLGCQAAPTECPPRRCGPAHPNVTFCPSDPTPGQCDKPMPHAPCPVGPCAPRTAARFWDFRNASAVAYHTKQVTGYFAGQEGVDAVFFGSQPPYCSSSSLPLTH